MSFSAPFASRSNGQGPLSSFKRTLSRTAPDQSSTELTLDEWPLSDPPGPQASTSKAPVMQSNSLATGSAARSAAHWGAKADQNKDKGKRDYPWEHLGQPGDGKRQKTAYHTLSGPGGSKRSDSVGSSKDLLQKVGASSANIRQRVVLSTEQQEVLRLVVDEGKSVFFTGSAGTGKSVLLREIIASLRKKYSKKPDAVAVTASTGMAACNIGGSTIHSFAGIGLGVEAVEVLVQRIRGAKGKKSQDRWRRALVLVIDEVSMVDGQLFDKLDGIARAIRKKPDEPFGGIQLVVTGDFFQLPPVGKGSYQPKYAFEAKAWKEGIEVTVNLTQVFRQKDTAFVDMLNELRFGNLSPKTVERFVALRRPVRYDDDIEPTQLCALRNEVDRANNERLIGIKLPIRDFHAVDTGDGLDEQQLEKTLDNLMVPKKLSLKPGAQVMYLKNSPEMGLVNGTLGKVIRFAPAAGRFEEGEEELDMKDSEYDQSLVRKINKSVKVRSEKEQRDVPWIQWSIHGNPTFPCQPEEWKIEANGQVKAKRVQFPLMLSWAVSIHKSQGQTLDRVRVDLRKIFEAGQAYVALSRATSMERLEVTGFDPAKVTVNRKVVEWSKTLQTFT